MTALRRFTVACGCAASCSACAAYTPGALVAGSEGPLPSSGSFGCLDIATFARSSDPGGLRVGFRFGNRCLDPVRVDLSKATVRARVEARLRDRRYEGAFESLFPKDGEWVTYASGDPAPGLLDPGASGQEVRLFRAPWQDGLAALNVGAITVTVVELCVDPGPVVDPVAPGRSLCFGDREGEAPLVFGPPDAYATGGATLDPSWNVHHRADLSAGLGLSLRSLPMPSVVPKNAGYVFPAQSLGTALAWSLDYTVLRVGIGRFHFDLFDFSIGVSHSPETLLQPSQVGATAGGDALTVSLGGLAGVEVVRFGRVALDLDVASGARYVRVANNLGTPTFPSCARATKKNGTQNRCSDFELWFGQIEPRAAVDVWVTPWLAIEPWFGVDVVPSPVGLEGGVQVSGHTRAFGEPR